VQIDTKLLTIKGYYASKRGNRGDKYIS